MSSYSANFLNWEISKHGILHEKKPQYPVYSLPFKGESSYKKTHSDKLCVFVFQSVDQNEWRKPTA
jgi:hypothetical protein